MRRNVKNPKRLEGKLCLLIFVSVLCLYGCGVVDYFTPEGPPYDEELYENYDQTTLKVSNSSEVLAAIHRPEYELLSQSESVVASFGQKKKGHKKWFNMVAFDENKLTASRKYLFIVDDRPNLLEQPKKSLRFDCEVVVGSEVLNKPYGSENAKRIAILKEVLANVRKDVDEVSQDNKMLGICGMMINQALRAALVELDQSPVLASKLSEPGGVDFSHINLGKGKIGMVTAGDVVMVKMRLGRAVRKFEETESTDDLGQM